MIKIKMSGLIIFAVAFVIPTLGSAELTDKECPKELMMSYYPGKYVSMTLEKYQVPKAQHTSISNQLAEKDKEIIRLVEERAEKMDPNPLRDPSQRDKAVKIFRETLYEQFADVMKAHGIDDSEQIQVMLDDIQQQKAQNFARCMEKYQKDIEKLEQQTEQESPHAP